MYQMDSTIIPDFSFTIPEDIGDEGLADLANLFYQLAVLVPKLKPGEHVSAQRNAKGWEVTVICNTSRTMDVPVIIEIVKGSTLNG
jgi:hypothetical protein